MRTDNQKMNDAITAEIGGQVSVWLKEKYARDAAKAKRVARDFEASPNTAEKWLGGCMPSNKHMAMMVKRWGMAFLAHAYEPLLRPWRHTTMDQELTALRQAVDAIEREYRFHGVLEPPARAVAGAMVEGSIPLPRQDGQPTASETDEADGQPRTAAAARG